MYKLSVCVILLVCYVCVSVCARVVVFSVEPADESCHIKDKGLNQFIGQGNSFCWVRFTQRIHNFHAHRMVT